MQRIHISKDLIMNFKAPMNLLYVPKSSKEFIVNSKKFMVNS